MPNRRNFLRGLSALPLAGGVLPGPLSAAARRRSLLRELGIRPIINAAGTYTALTASLMPLEVRRAWEEGAQHYVRLDELHDAVGRRIAEMLQCEAAMVTAGAASALTLGTAACMTGTDREKIRRLPDTTGMKTEVIIQKSHRFAYDHAVRNCGTRMVEVETREDLERAVNERTVMMLFLNKNDPDGQIKVAEFAELGEKHNIPTFNDAAADVPPADNLFKYIRMGYSLVTFSGGKGLQGPQSAGLLYGRRDLIEAARLNTSPHADSIGRGMKVNKEELLAMLVALELYLNRDHRAEWREWEKRAERIVGAVSSVPGVHTEIRVPEIANHSPHIHIRWEPGALRLEVPEAVKLLREGDPPIEIVPGSRRELVISVWMMQPGDDRTVARRLREILRAAV